MNEQSGGFTWTQDGRLLFNRFDSIASGNSSNLWQIGLDPDTGVTSGEPVKLTHWDGIYLQLSGLSKDGKRLVVIKKHLRVEVCVGALKENGKRLEKPSRLTISDSFNFSNSWSHDGKSLLFNSDRAGRSQIYRQQLGQEAAQALISGPDDAGGAELTPDGVWILYQAAPHTPGNSAALNQSLMRVPASGGAPQRIQEIPGVSGNEFHCASRTASACVISRMDKDQIIFYSLDPIKGQGKKLARTKVGSPGDWMNWSLSPDAVKIALTGSDQLYNKVRVIDLRTGVERDLPLPPSVRLNGSSWSADGLALYATGQSTEFLLLRLDLSGNSQILLNRGRSQFLSSPRASPDGRSLALSQQSTDANAFLLENF